MADQANENSNKPATPKGVKVPKGDKAVPYEKSQMTPGRDGRVLTR